MVRKTQLAEAPALFSLAAPVEEAPPGHIGHRERLRRKLLAAGSDALADYELLELLLFFAILRRDTKPVAKALVARFGSFGNVLAASPAELREVKGVGDSAVAVIKASQAAALRLLREEVREQPVLNNWERLSGYLTAVMSREPIEQFRILFLDTRNRLIADEAQAKGTVNHTPVYPREVVKRALELSATAVILVHNHPSGDPTPSQADITMTLAIVEVAKPLGIAVHDHIIVGKEGHASFKGLKLM